MNNKYNNKDYNYYGEGIPTANPTFWRMPDLDIAHANTARHRPTFITQNVDQNRKWKPEVEITTEWKELTIITLCATGPASWATKKILGYPLEL